MFPGQGSKWKGKYILLVNWQGREKVQPDHTRACACVDLLFIPDLLKGVFSHGRSIPERADGETQEIPV